MEITINLLPPGKKEEIKKFRTAGVIFKIGISALFALLVMFVFMRFCVSAIMIQKEVFDKEIARFIRTDSYVEVEKAQSEIKTKSEQARRIKGGLNDKTEYWKLFEDLNSIMPDDVFLKQIAIADGAIKIKGFAIYRESLLILEDKLKENENFLDVESPISNLIAGENVEFEFTAAIKEK